MSNFPTSLDDDSSIWRVDDNVTEIAGDVINQLRGAVYAVEANLGLSAKGSLSDLSARLNVSLNPDGTIKASALTSIGLVVLPITNSQIGVNAGILESKLSLNFSTSNLNTLIQANSVLLASLSAFEAALEIKVNSHISGSPILNLRHVASHIDLNAVPSDSRDPSYIWSGLIDKDGYVLSALNVADGLNQINTNLTSHQNQVKDAHAASAISVDASNFSELLTTNESVQDVLDNIDDIELLQLGTHRATQHTNGIPKAARSLNLSSATTLKSDGYNLQVLDPTPCETFVIHNPPGISPIDSVNNGDSIVVFKPTTNVGSVFDSKFSQVKIGDIIRINYGTIEDLRRVESIRYVPGAEWVVRINGVNLIDSDGYASFARIDRPLYDSNVYGVLAVASANAVPLANYSILGSVIIGDPRGATAFGMNFDANKLGPNNYKLYLELYPTGNPADHVIKLPAIDVTGNAGITQGYYNLDNIILNTNNAFRATGFNYRFIAFGLNGNFGIMLADSIDGASFAIINGTNSTGSLTKGTYVNNVVGDVDGYHVDPFGFGFEGANLASPTYQATWLDATAAQFPTKIIHPVKSRNYIVNGRPFDLFASKELTTNNFWIADIDARNVTGSSVEVTYKVNFVLETAGLKPGKTILIQPAVGYSDPLYNDVDYGRFIIKSVVFNNCHCVNDYTLITVINGIHGTGNPLSSSGGVGLPVRIYFDEGSVSFDDQNIIDSSDNSVNYHRHHEIYITDQKTTFSHERARLIYQSETSQLIDTNNWHIVSVSSKFRGYRDLSGSALNKYIRLFLTNYNSISGEFDGYLGQRNLSNPIMQHSGQIVRGRKNVPVKFYDDSNIDYIELILKDENTSSPGIILPTNKWIDIELFDSLRLDQELLPLATCEVNWNPAFGKNIVEYVRNLKQYGSISELEFTQSAIDFITSGEKYLHQNGVIYGFDAEFIQTNISQNKLGQFLLHGGIALVNGKIVTANSLYVRFPVIKNTSNLSAEIPWAICVDDNGTIKSFPLNNTKIQFFAQDANSSQTYYLPSYSFIELLNKKDLTILYIVNIAASTSLSPTFSAYDFYSDARKFIKNETGLISLTWTGKDVNDIDGSNYSELIGHFRTFDQVQTWINWTKSPNNIIKVKGNITSDSTINLSVINYPTVFDGENGCIFNLNSTRGIILGSNITLKNINFNWNPGVLTYTAGDNVNLDTSGTIGFDSSNGCLYSIVTDGFNIKNITIDNCNFTGIFPQTQRPPYISMVYSGENTNMDNINIINNKFIDPNGVNNQSAIAIVLLGINSNPTQEASITNSFIQKNTANNNQNIILSIRMDPTLLSGTLNTRNVFIEKNNVGAIGYRVTSSWSNGLPEHGLDGLVISDNTALFIGNLDTTGHILDTNLDLYSINGTGDIIIKNNKCTTIYCNFQRTSSEDLNNSQSLLISTNKLRAKIFSEVSDIYGLNKTNTGKYTGIYVNGTFDKANAFGIFDDNRIVQILDNLVVYYFDQVNAFTNNLLAYEIGIFVDSCGSIIKGNIVQNFTVAGILSNNHITRDKYVKCDIIGNQLYNKFTTAQPYIGIDDQVGNMIKYTVTNNSFDTYQTNGSFTFMITTGSVTNENCVIKDNTNQTDSFSLRAMYSGKVVNSSYLNGVFSYKDLLSDLLNGNTTSDNIGLIKYASTSLFYTAAQDPDPFNEYGQLSISLQPGGNLSWIISPTMLNKDVKFVSATIGYKIISTVSGAAEIRTIALQLRKQGVPDTFVISDSIVSTTTNASGILRITTPDLNNPLELKSGYYLSVDAILDPDATNNASIFFADLILLFRY